MVTISDFGADMHYLEFYYHCVARKLSGRFDTEFWSRTILQMAHVEPSVRCALIALGHLNQHQNGSLKHAHQSAANERKYERRPFWSNYNKAIRHLINDMNKPHFLPEAALVTCLLFACIEFLQANANPAFTHIRSGLNIVSELRQRGTAALAEEPYRKASQGRTSLRSNMIEQILVPILTQALASALPYGSSIERDFTFLESCPKCFKESSFASLADARSSFFDLRNAAILLARDMAVKLYQSIPLTTSDYRRRDRILKRHCIWLQALQAFESSRELVRPETLAISALKVGYHSSFTACACIMDGTQLAFDAHLVSFRLLIYHASDLIVSSTVQDCHTNTPPLHAAANFTFDTSLIPALFYTAIRCRCPITRREAIRLLASDLPREGLWDPEQHRVVAERVVEIEEMEVDVNGWPIEASRLCSSSVGTDVDEKNGFWASFLYTKDLAMAATRSWAERLILDEIPMGSFSLGHS